MLQTDCQRRLVDLAQASGQEQHLELAPVGARTLGLVVHRGVELARRLPELSERPLATTVIPDARSDDAVPARHPRHLGQTRDRIRHEVDDELCKRGVECSVREWQVFRGRPADVDTGIAHSDRGHERFRGSAAATDDAPTRVTSSAVSAPGPQPTSSTRWPARTPARSANSGESRREYLPMNPSYASAATSNPMREV